jgi:hypothetical protein
MPKPVSGQLHPTRVANLFLFFIRPVDSNIEEQYIIFKFVMDVIKADFFNLNALSLLYRNGSARAMVYLRSGNPQCIYIHISFHDIA